jgi:hypothetical protein
MNKKMSYILIVSALLLQAFAWVVLKFILNYSFEPDALLYEEGATVMTASLLAVFGGGGVIMSAYAIYLSLFKGNWKSILVSLLLFLPVLFLSAFHFIAFLMLCAMI